MLVLKQLDMSFKLDDVVGVLLGRKSLLQFVPQVDDFFDMTLIRLFHLVSEIIDGLAVLLDQFIQLGNWVLQESVFVVDLFQHLLLVYVQTCCNCFELFHMLLS